MSHQLLKSIQIEEFLSFGTTPTRIDLKSLNVLIGPNGAGKSNFLHALRLLKCTESGLSSFVRRDGSIDDYIWKGTPLQRPFVIRAESSISGAGIYLHEIAIGPTRSGMVLPAVFQERITRTLGSEKKVLFENSGGAEAKLTELISLRGNDGAITQEEELVAIPASRDSILAHADSGKLLGLLRSAYRSIYISVGSLSDSTRDAVSSQPADLDQSYLFEDSSNLTNVIESLQHLPEVIGEINIRLKRFYPKAVRLVLGLAGNRVTLFLEEEGLIRTLPANRLSSGTIAFITLAVMLLHPDPPKVICLEQPEDGLHPDAVPSLVEMLVKASERTQIIVATHSETLVSALSDQPESVLVFEPSAKGTRVKRLDAEQLKPWLEKYSLGELWASGEIGGVRL